MPCRLSDVGEVKGIQSPPQFLTFFHGFHSFPTISSKDEGKNTKMGNIHLSLSLMVLLAAEILYFPLAAASTTPADKLTANQSLLDDGSSLVSDEGSFELGFFSPGRSKNRYLGLWYNNIPDSPVVWVANRAAPINDTSGVLTIDKATGDIVIFSHSGTVNVWSSNHSTTKAENPVVQLLASGNIVLRDENEQSSYLWQSFDYPSDTMLPGMKLGWDAKSGLHRRFTAWKSLDDPSPGELSLGLENAYSEMVMKKGSQKVAVGGPWNGITASGFPTLKSNSVFSFVFVSNEEEDYFSYQLKNTSVVSRIILNETTSGVYRYVWIEAQRYWSMYWSMPGDQCENYAHCGANGICVKNDSPFCKCLKGFEPKSPQNWEYKDWTGGCVRTKPLNCSTDEFIKITGIKLPDTATTWLNRSMSLQECKNRCLQNCSCTAYANSDIRGQGSGCAIWTGDLIDIRQNPSTDQDLYIRMPYSDSDKRRNMKIVLTVVLPIFVIIVVIAYCIYRRQRISRADTGPAEKSTSGITMKEKNMELPVFSLATITKSTDNFSIQNKLGEGGFGTVYKGILEDGQEVAVKRLSKSSGQGQTEFKNEVLFVAKLQHRNLVTLLGSCLEGNEKMLVYEYMPNRSLDHFIFDNSRAKLIDWPNRFFIICGVARGLLYLHQDSILRIIHRDLKASNILLDKKMNPKISDFGMAKTFGGDQIEERTRRIVGTYGYMAPEYSSYGVFSMKSDVFSFGILVLEIISGNKTTNFCLEERSLNLIGYAWMLWKHGRAQEFVAECLIESFNCGEVVRCIHIGLLCVQEHPDDRPTMSSVVLMLGSEIELPDPKEPAFFIRRNPLEPSDPSSSSKLQPFSINGVSMTLVAAR